MKQLHDHCKTCIGQHVVVHHKNGKVYQGILHSVDKRGIYIRQHHGHVSLEQTEDAGEMDALQPELAFFGGLAFGVGAGIGLGLTFLPWLAVGRFYGGGLYW
jgi:hypothetical protein